MPKKLEESLRRQAKKKNLSKEEEDAYVYGAMRKAGWIPSTQKKGNR